MNEIKMIVTDLDRTLLRTDKKISARAANVLARCRDKGIKTMFATARPLRAAFHFLDESPVDALAVHNGAAVYIGGSRVLHHAIELHTARDILRAIARDWPAATLSIEIDDVIYANFDLPGEGIAARRVTSDFEGLPHLPAEKVIIGVSGMDDMEKYKKYIPEGLYIELSHENLALIMSRNASKQNAVREIAARFGCTLREVVAFGDDYNDVEMLRQAGVGVAVGNALDVVKSAADCVCGTNDDDGVAEWIEQNIL